MFFSLFLSYFISYVIFNLFKRKKKSIANGCHISIAGIRSISLRSQYVAHNMPVLYIFNLSLSLVSIEKITKELNYEPILSIG